MQQLSTTAARALAGAAASALVIGLVSCTDAPTAPQPAVPAVQADKKAAPQNEPPPPSGLLTVAFGGNLTLWPFTANDFGEDVEDPINAIFRGAGEGHADPLRIRAALRRLSGDRTAFGLPNTYPFNCTWRDAVGNEQTAYAVPEQWTGSAVQLQCGEYGPVRFHLRLFKEGPWTLAGTHMDLHIANTDQHRSISWLLPREVLRVDMIRTGLLGAGSPSYSAPITPTPTYGSLEVVIWNAMPVELKALVGLLGGPAIPNDGRAVLFMLAQQEPIVRDLSTQDFEIQYNQTVPKPFCAGPTDFVNVTGPLHFQSTARVTAGGSYERIYHVDGDLDVRSVNPATGQLGPLQKAKITDYHEGSITPAGELARHTARQVLFAADGQPRDVLTSMLHAGTRGHDLFRANTTCGR